MTSGAIACAVALAAASAAAAPAAPLVTIGDTGAPQSVVAAVEVLHDASGTLTADDVHRGSGASC